MLCNLLFSSPRKEKGEQGKGTEQEQSAQGEQRSTERHHLLTGSTAMKERVRKTNSSVIFPNLEGQVGVESNDSL